MRTNAGADWQAAIMGNSAASGAGTGTSRAADYLALTANATAPSAADTTLTGEITTAGGGLIRSQATYAHTTAATNYTLTKTFTANGSDSLPVTIAKYGNLNASSTGTLVFESLFSTTATISASGDQLVVTATISI